MNENNKLVVYAKLDKIMKDNLYPSATTLYDLAKQQQSTITRKDIKEYLSKQTEYQVTKERRTNKPKMGHVVAFAPWSLVQIDLLDMQKYSFDYSKYKPKKKLDGVKTNFNKGFKYIMIMIDVFTRFVDVVMLKSKNVEDCVHALKIMLDFNGVNPDVLMSDSEGAFHSKEFQKLLSDRSIIHDVIVLNDHHALSVLDRFCRTLRSRFTKLFIGNKNTEWTEYLSTIQYQYNNSSNRGILNFTPQQVLTNSKIQEVIASFNHEKNKKNIDMKKNVSINKGDMVRVFIKDKFKKGTDPSYTSKIYEVESKSGKNITLTNGKTYVYSDLQKIDPSSIDESSNAIEDAKREVKISKVLKNEGIDERPTYKELSVPRQTRNQKVNLLQTRTRGKRIDYVKLNKG